MAHNDPKVKIITSIMQFAARGSNNRMFDNKWYRALDNHQGDGRDPPFVCLKPSYFK